MKQTNYMCKDYAIEFGYLTVDHFTPFSFKFYTNYTYLLI